MKNQKKLTGLGIGLVCVILCMAFLTSCARHAEPGVTEPTIDAVQSTDDAATQPTEVPEEPTEAPIEDSTEPTEEPTEPVQDSSSGGSSTPGGTSGFTGSTTGTTTGSDTGSSSDDNTTDSSNDNSIVVADPGTESNAYTESLGDYPDSLTTVKIPTEGTVYYHIYHADGTILTIEDGDAYVVYNGKTYRSVDGVVTVELNAAGENEPVSIQLGNGSASEKAYSLQFAEPVGAASNPEILTSIDEIKASIGADRLDGYYFTWTAEKAGTLSLTAESVTPENVKCDIILTNGDVTVKASESAEGIASVEVSYGEKVTIQVVVEPVGTAAEILIRGNLEDALGSLDNPIWLNDVSVPVTAEVKAGEIVYYTGYIYEMTLTAENANGASVLFDGVTYGADANGVLTVVFPAAGGMGRPMPVVIGLCNGTDEDAVYTLNFAYPVGNLMNPEQLVMGENTAVVAEGSSSGYWYTWTAPSNGELTITMDAEADWSYVVNNITAGIYGDTQWSDSEPKPYTTVLTVTEGDEIQMNVCTFDPATFDTPAGEVTVTASFKAIADYAVCEQALAVGTTSVTADGDAAASIYRFIPTEAGIYVVTTDSASAQISYWGSDEAAISNQTDSSNYDAASNTLTISVPEDALGATYLIGISGAEQCNVTVSRVTESIFEGETEPSEKYVLTLDENQSLEYLDLTLETGYNLVLDEQTGIYHLDSVTGPLVYVNLGSVEENPAPYVSMYELLGMGESEAASLYWEFTDEQTGDIVKELFNDSMSAYVTCADETYGVYPLTEDLMYMLQNSGAQMGWWDEASVGYLFGELEGTLNKDTVWMFACCYVVTEDQSAENPAEVSLMAAESAAEPAVETQPAAEPESPDEMEPAIPAQTEPETEVAAPVPTEPETEPAVPVPAEPDTEPVADPESEIEES